MKPDILLKHAAIFLPLTQLVIDLIATDVL